MEKTISKKLTGLKKISVKSLTKLSGGTPPDGCVSLCRAWTSAKDVDGFCTTWCVGQ